MVGAKAPNYDKNGGSKVNGEYYSGDLWKYCTSEQIQDTLRSFRLLDGLSVSQERYFACLYAVSNHTELHYHDVSVQKKHGGTRILSVPDQLLSTIQRNILHHVLSERKVSDYATAYHKGASVLDNARPHVGAAQILKLDIHDFFGSITFPMVYQYAFPAEYYPPAIRTLLTALCCRRDCLPQGAPTSPAVSNLVMQPFDSYMGKWCGERHICYTRYCDDMTFSGEFDADEVHRKVWGFLHRLGMELNEQKTRVQRNGVRQSVTGIVVNEKPQVSREYRRKLRAEIYCLQKYGAEERERTIQRLLGKINYVLLVNPEDVYFRKKQDELKLLQRNE